MITSTSNPKVKHVKRLQADRRYREREKSFVVEGDRWLAELLPLPDPPQLIFYTVAWHEQAEHEAILHQIAAPAQVVSERVMSAMSDTETPPGVLAILSQQLRTLPPAPTLILILDRVRTPGNLGTMLRTAAAAGADAVLLGPGTVDAYNPKVLRGSMGAHLRLPVQQMSWPEIEAYTDPLKVWVADARGQMPYTDVNWRQPSALIIGSEASGTGRRARGTADNTVYVPMHAATESLNAAMAAGIILFEAARQRG